MKALFNKLHAKLGDFWWYSLMVFCAARVADFMNVFVGLWLVPKYVDPKDLGAVMPLTQFAMCLAIPISVFATTFRNEITELSVRGEFGRLKTLLRGTFVATAVFLALAIVVSWLVLPPFLERIRIVNGSLGILVIITAFVTSVGPIFNNALQALKKFRATSFIGILGAPLRLLTMLATMPLRALSGYFVGQCATPAFGIVASVVALKGELSVKAEPYWSRQVLSRVMRFAGLVSLTTLTGSFATLVQMTILRQRLPELDSAAYYMATRFSEISTFLSSTLIFTMFPYTAELAKQGKSTRGLVLKASAAMLAFSIPLAAFFWLFGNDILSFLPNGDKYAPYYWATPWMIGITAVSAVASFHTGAELSANRFGYLKWIVPIDVVYPCVLLLITGYGYFRDYLPASAWRFLEAHNITSLESMLMCFTIIAVVKLVCAAVELFCQRTQTRT